MLFLRRGDFVLYLLLLGSCLLPLLLNLELLALTLLLLTLKGQFPVPLELILAVRCGDRLGKIEFGEFGF